MFLWLALRRRHWTADRRQGHGLDANDHCFLCEQEPKTIDHIIASCSFTTDMVEHQQCSPAADGDRTNWNNSGLVVHMAAAMEWT